MERITGKEVESMIEAYASIYKNPEVEQEVISEETQQVDEGIADDPRSGFLGQVERLRRKMFGTASERNQAVSYERSIDALAKSRGSGNVPLGKDGKPLTDAQIAAETKRRRLADPNYKPGQGVDSGAEPGSGGKPESKAEPKVEPKVDPKPAANPNVTKDGTKFERRLPTMAELRAAQAARKAAAAAGKDKAGQEAAAVKGGVSVSQRKPATTPPTVSAAKPAAAPASTPAAKPEMTAAGNRAAELAALRAKAKADTMNKSRLGEETELDVFDIIKEYLIGEGATEEEALQQMLTLTDEQRTEIIEGSCGSKKKKKGGYGK